MKCLLLRTLFIKM